MMGQRKVLCLALLLSAVCMVPVMCMREKVEIESEGAVGKVATKTNTSLSKNNLAVKKTSTSASFSDNMESVKETLLSWGGPTKLDEETKVFVRACVAARAQDWSELHQRMDLQAPVRPDLGSPVELVKAVFAIEDKVEARAEGRSKLQQLAHMSYFSSNMQKWKKEKAKALGDLTSWGFNLDAAHSRCAKGMTDDAYQCMMESACPQTECDDLKVKIRRRIDLKDFVTHVRAQRSWYNSMGQAEKDVWSKIEDVSTELEQAGYEWTKTKKDCRKKLGDRVEHIKERVLGELSVGEEVEGVCQEAEGKMCPEGTFATNQRRWNIAKGGAAMGTGFLVAKLTLLPLGTAIGTALGGPMGGTVGFFVGNALVSPIAAACGFWASRGPLECACFPIPCAYNATLGVCNQELEDDAATKNPMGLKLPMLGMKCALQYKSEDSCGLQECIAEDYSPALPAGEDNLFGSVGRHGKSIYNCLATSQVPSGVLAVAAEFPDGRPNNVEERNKIYDVLVAQDKP